MMITTLIEAQIIHYFHESTHTAQRGGKGKFSLKAVMVGLVTDKDSNVEKVSTCYSKFRVPMTKFMLEFAASKCLTTQTCNHNWKKTLFTSIPIGVILLKLCIKRLAN